MTERGRMVALLFRKSVFVPILIVFALFSLTIFAFFPSKVQALNEPVTPVTDRITGLWNTGVNNSGGVLDMPGPWGTPTPPPATPPATTNNEYQDANYQISNAAPPIEDPHWRLVAIDRPDNGTPNNPADDPQHCQTFSQPRQAVVIMPPWDGNLDPAGVRPPGHPNAGSPYDGGYVWWRMTMSDPAGQLLNNFYNREARWIGARSNSFHDSEGGTGIAQQSNGACIDRSTTGLGTPTQTNAWPTFVYRLEGGFNVGSCVNENTIRLNLYWAADDEFELILNEGSAQESVVVPKTIGGGVVSQSSLSSTDFRSGNNTLTARVRSSFPLTGFAIGWDEPTYECELPEPYFKVFGNDIAAGGDVAPCDLSTLPNPRATILAFQKSSHRDGQVTTTDHITGAGAQLGVFALGQIEGFHSGTLHSPRRSDAPESPVNGLTFGNFGDPLIGPYSGLSSGYNWNQDGTILDPNRVLADGGKGGQFRCIPDYYDIASTSIGGTPQTINTASVSAVTSGYYDPSGGALTLTGATNLTGKRTIVVNGDVYIDGNITLSYASGIPSLYIIAKGNIYIDRFASNVAGVFVAQRYDTPKATGDEGGTIYTCARGGANAPRPVLDSALDKDCDGSLTITGSFIANRIRLLRVNGKVEASNPNEDWSPDDNIAEIFKSSAGLYLSAPDHVRKPNNANVEYDSITDLPPIL